MPPSRPSCARFMRMVYGLVWMAWLRGLGQHVCGVERPWRTVKYEDVYMKDYDKASELTKILSFLVYAM